MNPYRKASIALIGAVIPAGGIALNTPQPGPAAAVIAVLLASGVVIDREAAKHDAITRAVRAAEDLS